MNESTIKKDVILREQNIETKNKNWKFYASIVAVVAIGVSTGLGIYYGTTHHSTYPSREPINLDNLTNPSIDGTEELMQDTDGQKALHLFIANNINYYDLRTNVEITSWIAPTYTLQGTLVLQAKVTTKYTGSITVTINAIKQTNLNSLYYNSIQGYENMNSETVFNDFLNENPNLINNVTIGEFNQPSYTTAGWLTIDAITNSKYSGSATITINAIKQTNLSDLNLISNIDGTIAMLSDTTAQEAALAIFLNTNNNYPDLKDNIQINTFIKPDYNSSGSIILEGINKYNSTIMISITKVIPTDQDIVDTVYQLNITFDAYKGYNQSLDNFISVVLHGEGNPDNPTNNPFWYIRGQLEKHINESDILNYVDLNKYQFIQFCIKDDNHTPLTDTYLNSHYQPGDTATVQVNFNYGDATNQYIDFNLQLRAE